MAVWTKGARCRQNNCPSRFWTVLDGRKVCQNGHMSRTVETTEDEEEAVLGRRLHIAGDSVVKEAPKEQFLYGDEARKRLFEVFKVILRHQVAFLTEKFKLDTNFEHVVRNIFIRWANSTVLSSKAVGSGTPADLVSLLAILRLGMHIVNVPVYFMDLNQLVKSGELVFLSPKLIPEVNVLAESLTHAWHQNHEAPKLKVLDQALARIVSTLRLELEPFDERPLIRKLVRHLFLPPSIYTVACRVYRHFTPEPSGMSGWEVLCGACVWFALHFLYRFDEGVQVLDAPDWDVWADLTRKYWDEREGFWISDERDVESWDEETQKRFVQFYRFQFLTDIQKPGNMANERLLNLLKLTASSEMHTKEDESVYLELYAALQDTQLEAWVDHGVMDKYYMYEYDRELSPAAATLETTLVRLLGLERLDLGSALGRVERRMRFLQRGKKSVKRPRNSEDSDGAN